MLQTSSSPDQVADAHLARPNFCYLLFISIQTGVRYRRSTQRSCSLATPLFMKSPAVATLKACIPLHLKSHSGQKEGTVTTYCKAVRFFLETYTNDGVIAEEDADMMSFTQPSNKSPAEYEKVLWNKVLRGDRIYDEYAWKGSSIEDLLQAIRRIMRSYWGSTESSTVHELARHAILLTKLQQRSHSTKKT